MGLQSLLIQHEFSQWGYMTISGNFAKPFFRYSLFCSTLKKFAKTCLRAREADADAGLRAREPHLAHKPQVPDRCSRGMIGD